MPEVSPSGDRVRFGVFELDLRSGELRKAGGRVGLQEQALQVLTTLLERPGDLVTRDELRQRLWPNGTFVDFDHGLNAVVNRLRDALGDSAESPRFIETLPRRGYRFVAPVDRNRTPSLENTEEAPSPGGIGLGEGATQRLRHPALVAVLAFLVVVAAAGIWLVRRSPVVGDPPARVVTVTRLAGEEDWPAFSPDGEQLAFTWSGEKFDNADIYVTLVGGTEARRLTTDLADDYAPSWSPDGRRIAFLRKVGRSASIHVTSPMGGSDLRVSDFPVAGKLDPALTASQITWSPDSRFVVAGRDHWAATGAPAGIYLVPLHGGQPRPITHPTRPVHDFSPAFSPDGRRLAYVSCDSRCDVRVVDVDDAFSPQSEARTLTRHSMEVIDGVAWSRDGQSIVFFGSSPEPVGIWRVYVDGNRGVEPVELAGEHAQHPATVASRDRMAFSRYGWTSQLFRFDPARPHERIAASSSYEGDSSFSADGRRLAFTSGRSGNVAIWVAAADGSGAHQLTQNTWEWQGSPSWSPDGLTVAFDAHDSDLHAHIWTIDAAGGAPRQLTKDAGDQIAPTWSADGRWIYYSARRAGDPDIWRVRSTGGRPEQMTRGGSGLLGYESFDGSSVLYQPKFGSAPLLLMPISGGPPRRLVDCVRSSAFAPVGRRVFYVACDPGLDPSLHTIDLDTGQDRTFGRLQHFPPDLPGISLAVSPDGKTVLYRGLVRLGGDLMLIENFR